MSEYFYPRSVDGAVPYAPETNEPADAPAPCPVCHRPMAGEFRAVASPLTPFSRVPLAALLNRPKRPSAPIYKPRNR